MAAAPGDAEAGHGGAGIGLVAVHAQDHRRQSELVGQRVGGVRVQQAVDVAVGMPLGPLTDLLVQQAIERLRQG